MKVRPVGGEMFHAGGRTDGHDEANSRFSQFCETRLTTSCQLGVFVFHVDLSVHCAVRTKSLTTIQVNL